MALQTGVVEGDVAEPIKETKVIIISVLVSELCLWGDLVHFIVHLAVLWIWEYDISWQIYIICISYRGIFRNILRKILNNMMYHLNFQQILIIILIIII